MVVTGSAVNPTAPWARQVMSGTYTDLWVYVLATTIVGGIAAALLHKYVIGSAVAPTDADEPDPAAPGDRSLATAQDAP